MIQAAQESLATTEERLLLDADHLLMALELAEDVAAVYASADEDIKLGYNQAFFTGLLSCRLTTSRATRRRHGSSEPS